MLNFEYVVSHLRVQPLLKPDGSKAAQSRLQVSAEELSNSSDHNKIVYLKLTGHGIAKMDLLRLMISSSISMTNRMHVRCAIYV